MAELKPLSALFNQALYRIPDYQRGYAWTSDQLKDLWSDLANLSTTGHHYTGVLTLKEIPVAQFAETHPDRWLLRSGFKYYHVIDGQQRLTSCMILLQCIIEQVREVGRTTDRDATDGSIVFAERFLKDHVGLYLYQDRPAGLIRTHKFGYEQDNPSDRFYRHMILGEAHAGDVEETFYTLNLANAKVFFTKQVKELLKEGLPMLEELFQKLTVGLLFNEYIIPSNFDEFVAFETMNNRGKRLSTLELLKNRLIYLSTLYTAEEADDAAKIHLRNEVNQAWRMVYHELGRNKNHPLNDDDLLRAHWIMYFMYSRRTGEDHINYLLKEFFTSKRIHEKVPVDVELDRFEEYSEAAMDSSDENGGDDDESPVREEASLMPAEIQDYVRDLRNASHGWFLTWFPHTGAELDSKLADQVDRLNRMPMFYARPLVTALLLRTDITVEEKKRCLSAIERCFFIQFRLSGARANYGSSEFYNIARDVHRGHAGSTEILELVDKLIAFAFDKGNFKHDNFRQVIQERYRMRSSAGFYKWAGLNYVLYEYEEHLRGAREERKLDWKDLVRRQEKKHLSIEHILPQTPTEPYWQTHFGHYSPEQLNLLTHSLGNLLPLSRSINSSLQNDGFDAKVEPKLNDAGVRIRTGYREGCYSEIQVSAYPVWDFAAIRDRGLRMLEFMETRWNISLGDRTDKIRILHLDGFEVDPVHAQDRVENEA